MAALPYMQLYVADYLADTAHLTTEEHGAYLLLLFSYWQTGKPLRADRLSSVSRMNNERWTDVERTLSEFFHVENGTWTHFRVEADLEKVGSKSKNNSEAGKASARARALAKQELEKSNSTNVATNVERSHQRNVNHARSGDTDLDLDVDTDVEQKQDQEPLQFVGTPAPVKARRSAKAKDPEVEAAKGANASTWKAYADSYFNRYGAEPVRNAKVNGLIAQLVKRLGAEEAPHVAFYFVTINDSFLIKAVHDIGLLVSRSEAYRTQWATNMQMNGTTARQMESTQSNMSAAEQAKKMMREGGLQNAFLSR